jgi:putative heme iron utilization protein
VYAVDDTGMPFVFISDLAQHTKNLTKNPKCSLMMHEVNKEDVSNSRRITFAGKLVKVTDEKEREKLKKIYIKTNPNAEDFIDFADFNFYKMDAEKIQYIGGFGDINWVKPKDYIKNYK